MICITFDTDHMSDASMRVFLDRFDMPGSATFFCTQKYRDLGRGSDFPQHEVAIHPIFNVGDDWDEKTRRLRETFDDEIVGVRAHSCAYSHQYGVQLAAQGFEYVSQASFLFSETLKPFPQPWGVWELPICYMDSMDYELAELRPGRHRPFDDRLIQAAVSNPDALFVFDFHPVHVLLDSRHRADYREWAQAGRPDFTREANSGRNGAGDYFRRLIAAMRAAGQESTALRDVARQAEREDQA